MKLSLSINARGKLKEKFRVRERIGVAIINPRGVARGKKSTIVGG